MSKEFLRAIRKKEKEKNRISKVKFDKAPLRYFKEQVESITIGLKLVSDFNVEAVGKHLYVESNEPRNLYSISGYSYSFIGLDLAPKYNFIADNKIISLSYNSFVVKVTSNNQMIIAAKFPLSDGTMDKLNKYRSYRFEDLIKNRSDDIQYIVVNDLVKLYNNNDFIELVMMLAEDLKSSCQSNIV
ncbi:gp259 [Bacillus phage G]|uniref:Gp259 n=1 Tax=Bacillus phage G TaxID=2884420 RepID=G3MA00_9CAUD|nr:gp259 [Bacillus phage G]AEO93518.1 gp259 [Bacillus phage G]